jgi:hypothetical protein
MAREELRIPPPAAQITICGALNSTTLAALVELAMAAGAGLILQPRGIPTVVEAAAPPPALPPARVAPVRAAKPAAVPAAPPAPIDDRVRRALVSGPMRVGEFLRATRLDRREAQRLVASGAIVATGVTNGRRYALPGHSAKEAP